MITVGMSYRVLQGKEAVFEGAFERVVQSMSADADHAQTFLYRRLTDGEYLILSEWRTREAFQRFIRSPEFASVTDWGKAEILAARPRHQIFER